MQCFGLTNDYHRCAADAVDASDYCAEHRRDDTRTTSSTRQRGGLLNKFRLRSSQPVIPDGAKFNVPRWLKSKSTVQVAEELLHNSSYMTRWLAAFVLRKRCDPAAIDPLWRALQNDPAMMVRQQSAVALGKICTPQVLGPLIEALRHDRDAGVRQACAIALGNLGLPDASPELVSALGHDTAAFVRWDSAVALGQVGDQTVGKLLTELAEQDSSPVVRNACREALEEIKCK